jgi:PAS domain S-box-containing protein
VYCVAAAVVQAVVFFGTPYLNHVYDGWPRGWLVLSTAVAAALFGGIGAGLTGVAVGVALIWRRGAYFVPLHPGLEVFAAIGVFYVLVIHRLQRTRQTLANERDAFARTFHGNAAGMALIRLSDGVVMDVNGAYQRICGYEREELIGKPAEALWNDIGERDAFVARLRRGESSENFETAIRRKSGEEVTALVSAQLIEIAGEPVIVSSIQNITERKRAEEALREASSAKDRFLATLSHELRTPLNVVLGYARILRGRIPEADRMLEAIERNAVAQVRIVEDLLDMQRISRGTFALEKSLVDLKQLEERVVDALYPSAKAKGIHYHVDFDPISTVADGARLQQVLWNLLSNAIKFTPHNGCIGVYGKGHDETIVVRVVDSGEGIPRHFLPHVFEPFTQSDQSTTRRHAGMGLGLAIAKEIVELHGGEIRVESEGPAKGTAFTVVLPWIREDSAGARRTPPRSGVASEG